jgi:hypothetical protein
MRRVAANQTISRTALAQYLAGYGYKVDEACEYPASISYDEYKKLYDREGIAKRVVSIFPSECWAVQPAVYETEAMGEDDQTTFELAWINLTKKLDVISKLNRIDEISGIGQYGVLLLGTDDGRPLEEPFPGIDPNGNPIGDRDQTHNLLYLMPFTEGEAQVAERERDLSSTRYGKPTLYSIMFSDPTSNPGGRIGKTQKVHWTRCIHVADGCTSSDVFGVPRLQRVYNYILNIRKVMGGSAEMFWNGGFPGTAFQVPPELAATVELDKAELKEEIEEYVQGFKRYLMLQGVEANQLYPNIADPGTHIEVQMTAIAISIEVPLRIFKGSEEARLASMQDSESWNRRIHRRQDIHVTPNILRPFVDRLVLMNILPEPGEGVMEYKVRWPDVYAISEKDRADITGKLVRALAEYVRSGASKAFPFLQFLTMVMDFSIEQAEEVIMAAQEAAESGEYDFMEPFIEYGNAGGIPTTREREPPLGETRKVRIAGLEAVENATTRCQRDGKPGYKWGPGGKCFTYNPEDKTSQKRAMHKCRLEGAAREATKRLQNLEEEDLDGSKNNPLPEARKSDGTV